LRKDRALGFLVVPDLPKMLGLVQSHPVITPDDLGSTCRTGESMTGEIYGNVTCHRLSDGTVVITEAADLVKVSLGFLVAADPALVRIEDRSIVLNGQVWYEPVAFDPTLLVLNCRKVRDDRPESTR
jgi:hypothetical protein